ncbi:fructose-1,6-bisphosphatase / D-fructose-1,6-bisphosphate 1-phosphohydrolase / FBPase [Reticulomyxa filosa]|uniref:Fructose-1,6-bisphosphatase, cytosolic n=1 Tax=Reticulomyxa filosa TaxID=46433 RepID=X6LVQ2_RETFI|nr:fructose-1,6-bisphosphatase / D-fructose-1,6-bisphosphate 1-phosphohydrolase / FBPase [Reticulomyxa filosa]|eukprot:ETO05232.1 fructose-1,6-bisphosphatase / D-fructose-1,6-bisphosphate 1-phosphohydrolase / FBPase [Reticulomyxa filosa]
MFSSKKRHFRKEIEKKFLKLKKACFFFWNKKTLVLKKQAWFVCCSTLVVKKKKIICTFKRKSIISIKKKDPSTLSRWILKEQQKYPKAKGDLTVLLNSVQLACKIIANAAKGAGIYNLYGITGEENKSGDIVKKLDTFSNESMINCISFTGTVPIMASEEAENSIIVPNCDQPKYCVVFDPLDGSSNIDANVSIGTIFGIYRIEDPKKPQDSDLLQKGEKLVCSGYAMYGHSTMLVLTFGDEVNGFTLDPQIGEFILTHRRIQIPEKGSIYSINEGNAKDFDKVVTTFIHRCKNPTKGSPKKARYIGSMVADIHRTLLYGGIFMYPATKDSPNGKLRLLYELNPLAFIVEAAGGKASTGSAPILSLQPTSLHQRQPCFFGSKADVEEIEALYASTT